MNRLIVTAYHDKAEIRSSSALSRITELLETVRGLQQKNLMVQLNVPDVVIEPMRIEPVNVATPKKVGGMVLGTIVPLVLVLMTITGGDLPGHRLDGR